MATTSISNTIAVVGLGYVGLPLVVEFGKHTRTIGFDIANTKVMSCYLGKDPANELSDDDMRAAIFAEYTGKPETLGDADIIIIAVPTPVDNSHVPDFSPLIGASTIVGQHMKPGTTVIYESTVYPGATEEVCIPVLEQVSGLVWKQDFFVGYSPERVLPGDRGHALTNIVKLVSGDSPETSDRIASLYSLIVQPGVFQTSSIRVAEASKVVENIQRDVNIALMNELAVIFNELDIDTNEVLQAAGTKWNFSKFSPGLVGGHCISVDPYYLTHKAELAGCYPSLILNSRRINDSMGKFIADQTIKTMIACGSPIKGSRVNVLGITFKENCSDLRNSKVHDVIHELESYGVEVFVCDPRANPHEAVYDYDVRLFEWDELPVADAIIAAVSHREFVDMPIASFRDKLVDGGCFIDVKACFDQVALNAAGIEVWRL